MIVELLATDPTISDPLQEALRYGLLGIILIMFLTGWLWPKPAVDDLKRNHEQDKKIWEDQNRAILQELREIRELLARRG